MLSSSTMMRSSALLTRRLPDHADLCREDGAVSWRLNPVEGMAGDQGEDRLALWLALRDVSCPSYGDDRPRLLSRPRRIHGSRNLRGLRCGTRPEDGRDEALRV